MGFKENRELLKKNLKPDVLALVVLNVGDGDANIVVFPSKYGGRACALVDCYDAKKTIAALQRLKPQSAPSVLGRRLLTPFDWTSHTLARLQQLLQASVSNCY